MKLTQWDRHELIARYEALRREYTGAASQVCRGHGLALFIARGMHVWLEALTAVAPLVDTAQPHPRNPRSEERNPPIAAVRAELTTVLAGMVLACMQTQEVDGELRG